MRRPIDSYPDLPKDPESQEPLEQQSGQGSGEPEPAEAVAPIAAAAEDATPPNAEVAALGAPDRRADTNQVQRMRTPQRQEVTPTRAEQPHEALVGAAAARTMADDPKGQHDEPHPTPEIPKKPDVPTPPIPETPTETPEDPVDQTPTNTDQSPEKLRESTEFFFAFNIHSAEAGETAAQKFMEADCDVIAIEAPHFTTEEVRQEWSERHTEVASSTWREAIEREPDGFEAEATRTVIERSGVAGHTMKGLSGTDKRIELIDINQDHPDYPAVPAFQTADKEYMEERQALAPNAQLREAANNLIQTCATANEVRDRLMTDQLSALAQKYPGAKIGVLVGEGHATLVDRLHARGYTESTGIYIDGLGGIGEPTAPLSLRIVRDIQLNGPRELDETTLSRVVLEDSLSDRMSEMGEPRPTVFSSHIVHSMSDESVATTLGEMDHMKATYRPDVAKIGLDSLTRRLLLQHPLLPQPVDVPPSTTAAPAAEIGTKAEALPEPGDTGGEQVRAGQEMHIVYNAHSHASGVASAERLRDCQVVAIEASSLLDTEAGRAEAEEFYNYYITSPDMHEYVIQNPESDDARHVKDLTEKPTYFGGIAKGLSGSGTTAVFIDIADDHPAKPVAIKMRQAVEDVGRAHLHCQPNNEIKQLVVEGARAIAQANILRDQAMAEQLNALPERFPGAKIGVIMGRGHTPLEAQLRPEFQRSSIHLDYQGQETTEGLEHMVSAAHTLQSGGELTDAIANRLVLETMLNLASNVLSQAQQQRAKSPIATVRDLTDSEVAYLLEHIDDVKSTQEDALRAVLNIGARLMLRRA